MAEKYYTPEIEEFHVGFEYEYKSKETSDPVSHEASKEWKKHKLLVDDLYGGMERETHLTDIHYNKVDVRVKSFDEDDLKSLGFAYERVGFFTTTSVFVNSKGIEIWFMTNNKIIIYLSSSRESKIFNGTIKNKSELKKLMDQLGISYGRV